MQFIDLKAQSERIENRLIERFKTVLDHGAYILGPEVNILETQLADYVNVKHAITVASGTDALLVALMALDIGPGDEVITTPFSFFATAEVIALLGAVPVFVDIEPDTYNMDVTAIEAAITAKTKAILPVSLYGQCADLNAINTVAARYRLAVIEDAAQSFGAQHFGQRSCGLTTIACTSFFPTKPLGCYGDGGACFTNDDNLAEKIREIRVHGQSKRYYHTRLGITGRFDTIQAAFLLEKMAIFPEEIELRQEVAKRYADWLPAQIQSPMVKPENLSVFAQYTIQIENREEVQKQLQALGIPTAVHYPVGLHQQPIIKALYPNQLSFPKTEYVSQRVMSLPMHPYLSIADQKRVCHALEDVLADTCVVA